MAYKNAAPARKGGRRAQLRSGKATRTTGNGSPTRQPETSAHREWDFKLPWAPHEIAPGSITYKADDYGDGRYFVCSRRETDPGGATFLSMLMESTGAPSRWHVLDDPLRWLHDLIVYEADEAPAPLPRAERRQQWQDAAWATERSREYLKGRGLDRATVRRHKIMYNVRRNAIGLPVLERQRLVNVRWRYLDPPPGRPKILGLRGRGSQLYPSLPLTGPVVLCEGEFDALVTRRHGIAAVTSTCGASLPNELAQRFANRQVAVVYDTGADPNRTVERLRAAGAHAWSVDLGLPRKGDDLTDWFVTYGRSAYDLRRLLNRAATAATKNPNIVSLTRSSDGRDDGDR